MSFLARRPDSLAALQNRFIGAGEGNRTLVISLEGCCLFTIGAYPAIKPAQARREAVAALDRALGGIDPAVEKRARRYARDPQADTFGVLVQDYLERYARKNTAPGTFKETKRVLESQDLAAWRNRPISEISRRDVIDVIDRIAKRADFQANRTLARL